MKLAALLSLVLFLPADAQTTLNLSQDLVRLGIASTNMAPDQPSQDAAPLFTTGLQYASNKKIGKVIADPGSYYFLSATSSTCHMAVQSSSLTIDFQGADLYFADPLIGAVCANGRNITLQNFTVDYLKLPWTQVVVTSVDAPRSQISWREQPGWQNPSALNSYARNAGWLTIFRGGRVFRSLIIVQQPFADDSAMIANSPDIANSADVAVIRPGDVATLELTNGGIALTGNCAGCTFRNVRIYASPQGSVFLFGQSNLFERLYVMPRPGTDRLLSGHADIHLILSGPNNTFRLCRAIRKGDDGFSPISGRLGAVTRLLDNRTLQIQGLPGAWGDGINTGLIPPTGSTMEFQRVLDGAILGRAMIVSQTPSVPVTITDPYLGSTNQVNLTFDRDLSSDFVGSNVYPIDPDQRGAGLLLEKNTVQQQTSGSAFQLYGLVNATVGAIMFPARPGLACGSTPTPSATTGTHRLQRA